MSWPCGGKAQSEPADEGGEAGICAPQETVSLQAAPQLVGIVRRENDARDVAGRDVLGNDVALLDIVGYPAASSRYLFVPAPF
jgi:hypothetical protein